MNEFIYYIVYELRQGMKWAAFVCAVYFLLAGMAHMLSKKDSNTAKPFRWKKHILGALFCGYIAFILYAAIARDPVRGGQNVNLHLFRALYEAWNSFSTKSWLNIVISIVTYVPFGMLIPYLGRIFKKWYVVLPAGLSVSLVTELIQYFTGRGIFDVDDILENGLGIAIGYSLAMLGQAAFTKEKAPVRKYLLYSLPIIIAAFSVTGIYTLYSAKEYGNLMNAASFSVNTKNTVFTLQCDLRENQESVFTYQTTPYTKESCERFGKELFDKLGAAYDDVMYYDNMVSIMDHAIPAHFLDVFYPTGNYHYSYFDGDEVEGAMASEEDLREMLKEFGILIPSDAAFSYKGDGWHQFEAAGLTNELGMKTDGTVRCRYISKGILCEIENKMSDYEPYKVEEIISPPTAFDKICKGYISDGEYFEYNAPAKVEVMACRLEYQLDTKGFYQPVYMFELCYDGGAVRNAMVPALK